MVVEAPVVLFSVSGKVKAEGAGRGCLSCVCVGLVSLEGVGGALNPKICLEEPL